jgi:hypothetical protein
VDRCGHHLTRTPIQGVVHRDEDLIDGDPAVVTRIGGFAVEERCVAEVLTMVRILRRQMSAMAIGANLAGQRSFTLVSMPSLKRCLARLRVPG